MKREGCASLDQNIQFVPKISAKCNFFLTRKYIILKKSIKVMRKMRIPFWPSKFFML